MPQIAVPAAFYRGGTSRAVFFAEADLAGYDDAARRAIILAAMGSPDPYGRQLDGLGGGISSLSKVAIVGAAPSGSGADVTFTFGQVDVARPVVEFLGTCGNISAAVAPYAVDHGLAAPTPPVSTVRIRDVNTGQLIVSRIAVDAGGADPEGGARIDGVSGSGSPVELDFEPGDGSLGRGLLPTGLSAQPLDIGDGRSVMVSIVDAVNAAVFVHARDVGLDGTESPQAIDDDRAVHGMLAAVRAHAAVLLGLAATAEEADLVAGAIPKVVAVTPPTDRAGGALPDETQIVTRMLSMGRTHRAIAGSVAMCTAVAAMVPGTLVHEVRQGAGEPVRIGHPSGVVAIRAAVGTVAGEWVARRVGTLRTARRIMEGTIYVPSRRLSGEAW